jgi:hypothetical protein
MPSAWRSVEGRHHETIYRPGMRTMTMSGLQAMAAGIAVLLLGAPGAARAEEAAAETDAAAELAKKLQNPVAALISVPFQNNFDFGYGSRDAMRYTLNIQPVVPFSLSDDWNLITRTIVPVVVQEAPYPGLNDEAGLGDILQSLFLSPKEPVGGWIVGAGPALLYPSATNDAIGAEKWAAGPTVVVLQQQDGWTYGALVNHIASFAGNENRFSLSATFLQPFVSYTTKSYTTVGLNTEATYDWKGEQWTVPINLFVSQMLKIGGQPISIALGGKYYAEKSEGGPEWGLRFTVTLLFPK